MLLNNCPYIARTCISLFSSRASIVSKDGAMIICWHPKQDIPYEKTKPITRDIESLKKPFSPLRVHFDHTSTPTVKEIAEALCRSPRTIKPNRSERSFSPYYWDDEILRKRL